MDNKILEDYIITIPDFPKPGIMFRDVTGIAKDPCGLRISIDGLKELLKGVEFDKVVGLESRGFIFGVPVACEMGKGFVPVRKKGKLPRETVEVEYALEYGTAAVEMHKEDIKPGEKVVLVDDLLATGGSAKAGIDLCERLGAEVVKAVFVIELEDLKGREALKDYDVASLVVYSGE